MKTRVQKWGNSLAVRIPKSFATDTGLNENAAIELKLVKGAIVVRPLHSESPTLKELLDGITEENRPGEWETGPAVGRETW